MTFEERWHHLYRAGALHGIPGHLLDQNPGYVVRWMLTQPAGTDDNGNTVEGDPLSTGDDLAALALERARELDGG